MRAAIGGGSAAAGGGGIDLRDAIGKSKPVPKKSIDDRRVHSALLSPPPARLMPSLCRLDFDAVVAAPAPVHAHAPHWQQPARAFTNVFVKNFREDVTDEEFKQAFAGFGAITSAVVARDESGKSKRHGFVNFEAAEAALKCTQLLHGSTALAAEGEAIDVVEHLKKSERFAPAPYAKQHHPKVSRRRLHPPARRALLFAPAGCLPRVRRRSRRHRCQARKAPGRHARSGCRTQGEEDSAAYVGSMLLPVCTRAHVVTRDAGDASEAAGGQVGGQGGGRRGG
jgi:hypothetical protein